MKATLLCNVLIWLSFSCFCAGSEIDVYVYHDAPFLIRQGNQTDLSDLFISRLQKQFPKTQFQLKPSTKHEVVNALTEKKSLMILWVNPLWFNKVDVPLIASKPILWDSDHLISLQDKPVQYAGQDSLKGKTQCSVKDHYYHFSEPALLAGLVKEVKAESRMRCLQLIEAGKADYAVIERSAWLHMLVSSEKQKFVLSDQTVDAFSRGVLVTSDLEPMVKTINQLIYSLKSSKSWREQMRILGSDEFFDLFQLELNELPQIEIDTGRAKPVAKNIFAQR
ncbi:transporter substrate-binding domain-containing protein [Teredinibacter sp. KSP-S5-2]|uniref:transporter substrate-binding domain-containing protein n=1 Tax=Teredinibacter sp. KSP-S5-2 TaxID=3034506 RepID=UPI002934BD89|nr:transporter substrate-binding domain-containing protein [Teredinibacter sp. KSP-S5-2]WNO08221.1 transporter substrate-binding domain-containing protein [Teredinibacter sp. KSP-S5-2]